MGELVDDVEHAELPSVMSALLEEVVGPDVVGAFGPQPDARSVTQPQACALRLPGGDLQPLAPPDPLDPLVVDQPAGPAQQLGDFAIAVDWATARGYRQGDNPARWKGHLENLLPKRSKLAPIVHHPALPYAEIGALIADLRQLEGSATRAFEFLILTAVRTGEVLGARWDEINLAERVWTIPAPRMKTKREHRVPLSDAALAVLEIMSAVRTNEYVFPGRGAALSHMALRRTLATLDRNDVSVHGFRSTFRDWASETTAYPGEVAEMALAHAIDSEVEAAYRRGDLFQKRSQMMRDWARYCANLAIRGEVVAIGAARG